MGGVVWLGERGVGTRLPGWMGELVRELMGGARVEGLMGRRIWGTHAGGVVWVTQEGCHGLVGY